jgi:hypothetical protein
MKMYIVFKKAKKNDRMLSLNLSRLGINFEQSKLARASCVCCINFKQSKLARASCAC